MVDMMLPQNYNDLFIEAEKLHLYKKLILQINKDLLYANIDLEFDEAVLPSSLKFILHENVYQLIQNKFTEYLNLLYIIDVSEEKIKSLSGEDTLQLAEEVSFLILQREWQKVWFKNKYSK